MQPMDPSANTDSVLAKKYHHLLAQNGLVPDGAQYALIKQLDELAKALQEPLLNRRWWRRRKGQKKIKGLYIYGQVGRGKTMLMDLFYQNLPRTDKMRVHFHEFMRDVQEKLQAQRQLIKMGKIKDSDPILPVAAALAKQTKILCFDEFSVTDIADAMIVGRLFAHLFDHGVVLVATSNLPPDELYKNGLNRALFLPFIDILKNHVTLFNLDGPVDYRMEKSIDQPLYLAPLGPETARKMEAAFAHITKSVPPKAKQINLRGRTITIACAVGKVARFDFADLCAKPLAAYDYSVLAQHYRCFFIENVPIFDNGMRNEAKRFILLIDTLYEAKAKIFITAAAEPAALYPTQTATTESFEFSRTASRLYEMQSAEYLAQFSSLEAEIEAAIEGETRCA